MARGTQLGDLLSQLRHEIGDSSSLSVGTGTTDSLKHVLRRKQEELYDEYDWPFLRVYKSKTLSAGDRYYDWPSGLDPDHIDKVVVWHSGSPQPIERGIGFEEYAAHSSDDDERADPVLRWDVRWTGSTDQIEVWPIPASDGDTLQFEGRRPLSDLVDESDTADLDDRMIVLFAAAEILTRRESKDAEAKLSLARRRLKFVRSRSKAGSSTATMGGAGKQPSQRGRTIIRVS